MEELKKIHPSILKACKKNKVNKFSQIATLQDYLISPETKGNIKQSYLKNHKNSGIKNAEVSSSKMLSNTKIEKVIEDILLDNNITKNSIIKTHQDIQNLAIREKDYTNARETNRDFMKLAGMLRENEPKQGNTYIFNDSEIDFQAIDKLLQIEKA